LLETQDPSKCVQCRGPYRITDNHKKLLRMTENVVKIARKKQKIANLELNHSFSVHSSYIIRKLSK
jgi:hypothetical protein